MSEGIEKRRHVRFSAMGTAEVLVQGAVAQEAYLASIGRGGLGMYLTLPVEVNQLVLVNLRLGSPAANAEDLRVAARVRWTMPAGGLLMVGLAFERMSDARFNRLLQHLNIIEGLQRVEPGGSNVRFTIKE